HMRRINLVQVLTLFFFIAAVNISFAQNLGIHPTTLEYRLDKGQNESQAIHLTNGSDKKVQFRLFLADWIRDSIGGHAYYRPDTLPQSCSRWVTIDKSFVELESGKTADVN